jgi:hypothetical protein
MNVLFALIIIVAGVHAVGPEPAPGGIQRYPILRVVGPAPVPPGLPIRCSNFR